MKATSEAKLFGCILVVAIALAGVALYPMMRSGHGPGIVPPAPEPPKPVSVTHDQLVPPGAHIRGNPDAPVSFVIFSDFQCPSCAKTAPMVEKFIAPEKQQTVNVVYHHFRAADYHQYSELLAYGAEAAANQGKFWEMHDLLFKNQGGLVEGETDTSTVRQKVIALAEGLKLDIPKFRADMEGDAVRKKVLADNNLAIDAGAQGTPWMYVSPKTEKVIMIPKGNFTEAMKYLRAHKYLKE